MPSQRHEAIVSLLRETPTLLRGALQRVLGEPIDELRVEDGASEALGQVTAVERRADLVLVARHGGRNVVVVVEVQLRRDRRKRSTWPIYEAVARDRHGADVLLVVIAVDSRVATWAARPIPLGPLGDAGSVCRPIVVGPGALPTVPDPRHSVEELLLAILAHGRSATGQDLAVATLGRIRALDDDKRRVYTDLVMNALTPAVRAFVERLMFENYKVESEFMRRMEADVRAALLEEATTRGVEQGLEQGRAGVRAAVRAVLAARGMALPPDVDAALDRIRDMATLQSVLTRAATATDVSEVL